MRQRRWVTFLILLVAATAGLVTARVGIGCFIFYAFLCLPLLLLVLGRIVREPVLLSTRGPAGLLQVWKPAAILLVSAAVLATVLQWLPGAYWFDLATYPEPLFAHQTLLNVITLRPLAPIESYAGRFITSLYYIWAGWSAVHFCLVWFTEWHSPRGQRLTVLLALFACLASLPLGIGLLLFLANVSDPAQLSTGELAFASASAAALFAAGLFFTQYASYFLALLANPIRERVLSLR